jgi:hypothetical protein
MTNFTQPAAAEPRPGTTNFTQPVAAEPRQNNR